MGTGPHAPMGCWQLGQQHQALPRQQQPLGQPGWPGCWRVGPPIQSAGCRCSYAAGVTYFVLAPDYAAGVTFNLPAGYSTIDSLSRPPTS